MKSIANSELESGIIDWPVHMQRALELAGNVITATPNPRVGCVIVAGDTIVGDPAKDGAGANVRGSAIAGKGAIVGEGWHAGAGQAHAEVMALRVAGDRARFATAFVSLEPCSHSGRTGPCCEALLAAGIGTVVIAGIDPNPSVSGNGVEFLEAAGIKVFQLKDFEHAARAINPGYFKRRVTGQPFVRCKLAASLDGRTALANGESKWITGTEARSDVQRLRAGSSAIITGINTVLADDPALNVRPAEIKFSEQQLQNNEYALARQPLRVILDSKLRTPATANILGVDGKVRIYTAGHSANNKNLADNVEIVPVQESVKGVNLDSVLESLASDCECNEVLVEAGPSLSAAFIEAGLVDELILYIAPKLLGSDAQPLVEIAGLQSMSESRNFEIKDLSKIGNDIRVTLIPKYHT